MCCNTNTTDVGKQACWILNFRLFLVVLMLIILPFNVFTVPVYQLGVNRVCLTGNMLMSAGLPGK